MIRKMNAFIHNIIQFAQKKLEEEVFLTVLQEDMYQFVIGTERGAYYCFLFDEEWKTNFIRIVIAETDLISRRESEKKIIEEMEKVGVQAFLRFYQEGYEKEKEQGEEKSIFHWIPVGEKAQNVVDMLSSIKEHMEEQEDKFFFIWKDERHTLCDYHIHYNLNGGSLVFEIEDDHETREYEEYFTKEELQGFVKEYEEELKKMQEIRNAIDQNVSYDMKKKIIGLSSLYYVRVENDCMETNSRNLVVEDCVSYIQKRIHVMKEKEKIRFHINKMVYEEDPYSFVYKNYKVLHMYDTFLINIRIEEDEAEEKYRVRVVVTRKMQKCKELKWYGSFEEIREKMIEFKQVLRGLKLESVFVSYRKTHMKKINLMAKGSTEFHVVLNEGVAAEEKEKIEKECLAFFSKSIREMGIPIIDKNYDFIYLENYLCRADRENKEFNISPLYKTEAEDEIEEELFKKILKGRGE